MKVLTINTYGGSLLLGARALGSEIVGSYEDCDYLKCTQIQSANFPDVDVRAYREDWPNTDLSEVVVLAHPPCSAFSVQNTSPTARGVNSSAFKCTRVVLDYAMGQNALAIAVESVMGALGGAWAVHQQYADDNGYHLYRVLQNGCQFSAQWRERFWAVFVRKGAATPQMTWTLKPTRLVVKDVVTGYEDGPPPGNLNVLFERLKERFRNAGCDDEDMRYFFEPPPHHPTCGIHRVFQRRMFPLEDRPEGISAGEYIGHVMSEHIGTFSSGVLCYVHPDGLSPTILGGTWLYMNGRSLSEKAYKRLMGFPASYEFPANRRKSMRTYLSKGVIPQVAQWILGQVTRHLGEKHSPGCTCHGCGDLPGYVVTIAPDHIADFRIRKHHRESVELPPIRHEENV